jgi:hypothetical protein
MNNSVIAEIQSEVFSKRYMDRPERFENSENLDVIDQTIVTGHVLNNSQSKTVDIQSDFEPEKSE